MKTNLKLILSVVAFAAAGLSSQAFALPAGWTCTGVCGDLGPDGVVTAPPGGGTYSYVTTAGGVSLGTNDLNIGAETNGSIALSPLFHAATGDDLAFDFQYVTSDGAGYIEYAWARLLNSVGDQVEMLFNARTTPTGNTVPGFGLPAITATITPSSTPIILGTDWSPLGGSSGTCYSGGCGHTGWIHADLLDLAVGDYRLQFGVVNWLDTAYQSGLAFAGATIAGQPISSAVPEPGSLALLAVALVGLAGLRRRRV